MTWVRQSSSDADKHRCTAPTRGDFGTSGTIGDLWRCHCGDLWQIAAACDICYSYGGHGRIGGMCTVGRKWRPATLWQCIRHWRSGRRRQP